MKRRIQRGPQNSVRRQPDVCAHLKYFLLIEPLFPFIDDLTDCSLVAGRVHNDQNVRIFALIHPFALSHPLREARKSRRDHFDEKLAPFGFADDAAVLLRGAEVQRVRFLADVNRHRAGDEDQQREGDSAAHFVRMPRCAAC